MSLGKMTYRSVKVSDRMLINGLNVLCNLEEALRSKKFCKHFVFRNLET